MRTVRNPFVFLLQIINLLPPVRAGCSGSCKTTSAHACDAPIGHVPDLRVSTPWDSLRRGQATACAVDDWQVAAPCNSAVSSRPAAISTIGRGGCTRMRTIPAALLGSLWKASESRAHVPLQCKPDFDTFRSGASSRGPRGVFCDTECQVLKPWLEEEPACGWKRFWDKHKAPLQRADTRITLKKYG
ncbi:hypothetical protein HPB51_019591 [Rhipicephalus microplus]|uniref:Secreted protein n=1 Tax=Rhipicephalus microplus TaxID=6941 RepID=A0A9J6EP21_RHIMP|nr:hypothetical protein HPB51_019591 [Rhipicephalus microplus]